MLEVMVSVKKMALHLLKYFPICNIIKFVYSQFVEFYNEILALVVPECTLW